MNYTKLLKEADSEGLITKEKNLIKDEGRIADNKIAIRKNMETVKKTCALAEELGHYYTNTGDTTDETDISSRKQEYKARLWAYNKMVGLSGIISSFEAGCKTFHEIAEHLEVSEEFLKEALSIYQSKYGIYTYFNHYMICFEPVLTVVKRL